MTEPTPTTEPRTDDTIDWPKRWTSGDIAWVKRQIIGEYLREAAAPATEALRELRDMHERLHELAWDECEVCGVIRAALASPEPTPDSGLDVERLALSFVGHQWYFVDWAAKEVATQAEPSERAMEALRNAARTLAIEYARLSREGSEDE